VFFALPDERKRRVKPGANDYSTNLARNEVGWQAAGAVLTLSEGGYVFEVE